MIAPSRSRIIPIDATDDGTSRVGRNAKWMVLAAWIVLALALVPMAQRLAGLEQNDSTLWLPHRAEATAAFERARASFPEASRIVAIVLYVRDGGLTEADRAKAGADREALAQYGWRGQTGPLVPSADGSALLYAIALAPADRAQDPPPTFRTVKQQVTSDVPSGLRTAITGPAALAADFTDTFTGIDTALLAVTVGVVALILLATYRSPTLWLVPLVSVGVASQVAEALLYLLAKYAGLTVTSSTTGILTVLVFGAGTDYALLLVARYREELRRHRDVHRAMTIALRRTLPTILASGTTVILGMLCLLAAQMNSTRGLGPVAAIGVAACLLTMTTLLPALLVICGRWLFWPFVPSFDPAAAGERLDEKGRWARLALLISRRPRMIWLGTALVLLALASGTLTLRFGVDQEQSYTRDVSSVAAQHLLDEHYPGGLSAPATIYTRTSQVDAIAAAARDVPGVASVAAPRIGSDGTWAAIDAVLGDAADTAAAGISVDQLRRAVHAVPGADAVVGGVTAVTMDTNAAVTRDNWVVIPLILAVVLVVLIALLRALVAPVLLIASVVVSFLGSMGVASLIFAAIGRPAIYRDLVLYGFLFLVALGIDYTIFLMSRAREETARLGSRHGTSRALAVTGNVITSAGILLAATFSVLAIMPLTFILQLGLLVAIGVLLDTMVVRTLLVPALAVDVGPRIWWPSKLANRP